MSEHDEDVAIAVVFLPMVAGDDEASARDAASESSDLRLTCFWDRERTSGLGWTEHYQMRFAGELIAGLPGDDPLRARFEEARAQHAAMPMWDVAYFFERGVEWKGALPEPASWTKQFQFEIDSRTGTSRGSFWREESPGRLVASSWDDELARGMAGIVEQKTGTGPPP